MHLRKTKKDARKVLAMRPERPSQTVPAQDRDVSPACEATDALRMRTAPLWHSTKSIYMSQHSQQQPSFSFASASFQGCTINVYQAPFQLSDSEAQDLSEGRW